MSDTGRNLKLMERTPTSIGASDMSAIAEKWDTVSEVMDEISKKGFTDAPMPKEECPELTLANLTATNSNDYTATYVLLLAWFGYSSEKLAEIEAHLLQYKTMKEIMRATSHRAVVEQFKSKAESKKPSKEDHEERLLLNDQYQEVLHQIQRYEQARLLMRSKVDRIEGALKVISRQVEIRRLDVEQNRNAGNMPGRNLHNPFRKS